jgi:hypothetical protein
MSNALDFVCPTCDALPGRPCTQLDGRTMPQPHTKRLYVANNLDPKYSGRIHEPAIEECLKH